LVINSFITSCERETKGIKSNKNGMNNFCIIKNGFQGYCIIILQIYKLIYYGL